MKNPFNDSSISFIEFVVYFLNVNCEDLKWVECATAEWKFIWSRYRAMNLWQPSAPIPCNAGVRRHILANFFSAIFHTPLVKTCSSFPDDNSRMRGLIELNYVVLVLVHWGKVPCAHCEDRTSLGGTTGQNVIWGPSNLLWSKFLSSSLKMFLPHTSTGEWN